ncbi:condensation domain-containing protein, partial [Jeotgalicoccus sp. S0W5]|uniref:condensation domain-containing protein n=1 Tax=Jeotgalicoccus sp. S0W5 TaxID=2527874 RepID=UPI001F0D5F57
MTNQTSIQKIYDLSPMQEGMLYHSLLNENYESYFVQVSFSVIGDLDVDNFKNAVQRLVEKHDILRTKFFYQNVSKPKQVVVDLYEVETYFKDLSSLNKEEQKTNIYKYLKKDRRRKFNLNKDILTRFHIIKLSDRRHKIIWSFHHILLDGWSIGIVLKDLLTIYSSINNNTKIDCNDGPAYQKFIEWIHNQNHSEAQSYWEDYLKGYDNKASLVVKDDNKEKESVHESILIKIDSEVTKEIINLGKKFNVSLNTIIQAAWSILLNKYTNQNDIVFGAVHSGRTANIIEIESMVGLFINTVPTRVSISGNFGDMVNLMQQKAHKSEKYSYYPLYKIQERSILKSNLFDHILVFENYPISQELNTYSNCNEIKFDELNSFEQTNYPLTVAIFPHESIDIKFTYDSNIYDNKYITNIGENLNRILEEIIKNPERSISEINMLT